MGRILFNFIRLALAVVCLGALGAWIRQPNWEYVHESSDGTKIRSLSFLPRGVEASSFHAPQTFIIVINAISLEAGSPRGPRTVKMILEDFGQSTEERFDFAGVQWSEADVAAALMVGSYSSAPLTMVHVKYPTVVVVTGVLPLVWLYRRLRRRNAKGAGFPIVPN
jgi:hypothetical protein